MEDNNQIKIEISNKEALVLFEFLFRFFENEKLSIEDNSEKWVLEDILNLLEKQLVEPLKENYKILLKNAQSEIIRTHEGDE